MARAERRFADLFTDPRHGNLDAGNRVPSARRISAPAVREFGPYRFSAPFTDDRAYYEWSARHLQLRAALRDIPGISLFDDLLDPANAPADGRGHERSGCSAATWLVSPTSTGLVAEAYLASRDERYREWLLGYVDRWRLLAPRTAAWCPTTWSFRDGRRTCDAALAGEAATTAGSGRTISIRSHRPVRGRAPRPGC